MSAVKAAVFVAAGRGSRLGSRTDHHPKAFLPFQDFTLIQRSLNVLKNAGFTDIYIGTGYKKEWFERLSVPGLTFRFFHNANWENTGSMATLKGILPHIDEPFVLLESDLLYEKRALEILKKCTKSTVLASGKTQSGDEVWVSVSNGRLDGMSKKPAELNNIVGELSGIVRIEPEIFPLLIDVFDKSGNAKMDYETCLVGVSEIISVDVLVQEDLVWCEIDDEAHLKRAQEKVWPAIVKNDGM